MKIFLSIIFIIVALMAHQYNTALALEDGKEDNRVDYHEQDRFNHMDGPPEWVHGK